MAHSIVPTPNASDFVRRLCAEFDCKTFSVQCKASDGRRKAIVVLTRTDGPYNYRATLDPTDGPLPPYVVESVLNQLHLPLAAFGVRPGSEPPPPVVH